MVFTSWLDNMTSYHLFRLAHVLYRLVFQHLQSFKEKSVHYDGFSTLLFSVEVLSTCQARIFIKKSAGNAP